MCLLSLAWSAIFFLNLTLSTRLISPGPVSIGGLHSHYHSNDVNKVEHSIGKSIAGCATKINLAVNVHDNSITFILSDCITDDLNVVANLINEIDWMDTGILYIDKSYNSDVLLKNIEQIGCFHNISQKQKIKVTNNHMDWHL